MMLAFGTAVGRAVLVAVGEAARERHVESRDLQELLALTGIAQALRLAHALQRLSSVLVTPVHVAIPVPECVKI